MNKENQRRYEVQEAQEHLEMLRKRLSNLATEIALKKYMLNQTLVECEKAEIKLHKYFDYK